MERSHDPHRLAVASTAPGIAAISHHSAAYLHGLLDTEPPLVHVLSVRGTHPAPPPGVIPHHTRLLDPDELMLVELGDATRARPNAPAARRSPVAPIRVPVTPPATTVVMLAAYLDRPHLIDLVERALQHHCAATALWSAAMRRRRRGRCGPQRVIDALAQRPSPDAELASA